MINFFDIPILNFINHVLSNHFFNFLMPLVSQLGGGELYFALAVLLLFSRKKETKTLGILLIAGLTVSFYTVNILKVMVARPRPFLVLPNVILLAAEKGFSFPSNHATSAFMIATLLSNHFKRYAVFYLLAALIGISRIYLGVHYPMDIIGGALIGMIIGFFLIDIAKRAGFPLVGPKG